MPEPHDLVERVKVADCWEGWKVGEWYVFAYRHLGSDSWDVMMAPVMEDRRKQFNITSCVGDWSVANDSAYAAARALAVLEVLKDG
jgi:hypothetical protein